MPDFTAKQQKQIDRAKDVLQSDEIVLDVTTGIIEVTRMGAKTSRNGAILLVTDRRVILYTKKLGGYEMYDHVYGLLTAIDYKERDDAWRDHPGDVGDQNALSQVLKEDVERVAKSIRARMAAAHEHDLQETGAGFSPADEIKKLARASCVWDPDRRRVHRQEEAGSRPVGSAIDVARSCLIVSSPTRFFPCVPCALLSLATLCKM